MTSDIREGAPRDFGNLLESVALEKEELDGLPLFKRQAGIEFAHQRRSEDAFKRLLVIESLLPGVRQLQAGILQFAACVKAPRIEVSPPVEGPVIGDVNDPCSGSSVG